MSFSNYNRTFSAEEQAKMDSIKNRIVGGGSQKEYDYPEPVKGQYIATIDKMFLREEKNRLVFRVTMQLLEGVDENTQEFLASWPGKSNPKIPFARPVTGTKNDAVCLGSVVGLLNRFAETDEIEFDGNYDNLAETIDNVFATVKGKYAYLIEYNPEEFYRFSVLSILVEETEDAEETEEDGTASTEAVPQEEEEAPVAKQVRPVDIQKPTSLPPESEAPTDWNLNFDDDSDEDLPF